MNLGGRVLIGVTIASAMVLTPLSPVSASAEAQVVVAASGSTVTVNPNDSKKIERFHKLSDNYITKWSARKPSSNFKKALAEYQLALADWKKVNNAFIDAQTSIVRSSNDLIKVAKGNFNTAVTAANAAYAAAITAAKGSKDAVTLKKTARKVRDDAVTAAVLRRNDEIKAAQVTRDAAFALLGINLLPPVKPLNDGKGGVKG